MVRSMTGYGRAQVSSDGITAAVELKSVNSRYLEFSPRVLRSYSFLEDKIRSYIQHEVARGKVECAVQIEIENDDSLSVRVNESLAGSYVAALRLIAEKYGLSDEISVGRIASFPDVLSVCKTPVDEEKIWSIVKTALDKAYDSFLQMREREGEKLKADVLSRAEHILTLVSFVEERSPQTVAEYMNKLRSKMSELLSDTVVDEQRLLTEAAIFADKVAVAEETVRLRSHIDQLRILLNEDEPVGRKLDFLVQEINREANTIGSKALDLSIAKTVIDIKSEVEKIREQIQNIE